MRTPSLALLAAISLFLFPCCGGSDDAAEGGGGGNQGTGRFVASGAGILTDTQTGYMWQQADDNVQRDWNAAVTYCNSLTLGGFTNWILPDVDELMAIVNTDFTPTIDPAFTGTNSNNYWSSTESGVVASSINFSNGFRSNAMFKTTPLYCRCVRK